MNYGELQVELQKRCVDLAQLKHGGPRYGDVLNRALASYPRDLWPLTVDSSTLDTVADTLSYALSGLSDITQADQVRRVWLDDSDGEPHQIGRFEIQDNAGALSLVLDEAPDDAYDITIEYHKPPSSMSATDDTTEADDAWLLDAAMVLLLQEADPAVEDQQIVLSRLELYTSRLVLRGRELRGQRRRPARKVRSTAWRRLVQ